MLKYLRPDFSVSPVFAKFHSWKHRGAKYLRLQFIQWIFPRGAVTKKSIYMYDTMTV